MSDFEAIFREVAGDVVADRLEVSPVVQSGMHGFQAKVRDDVLTCSVTLNRPIDSDDLRDLAADLACAAASEYPYGIHPDCDPHSSIHGGWTYGRVDPLTVGELRRLFGDALPLEAVGLLLSNWRNLPRAPRPIVLTRMALMDCAERHRTARLAHGGRKGGSLPVFDLALRGPFGPSLYIRFGRRTSFILKRTRNELFSERNCHKRVRRFLGWSWQWQAIQREA